MVFDWNTASSVIRLSRVDRNCIARDLGWKLFLYMLLHDMQNLVSRLFERHAKYMCSFYVTLSGMVAFL